MTVNSYPMSDRISRRAGDDDPRMILNEGELLEPDAMSV